MVGNCKVEIGEFYLKVTGCKCNEEKVHRKGILSIIRCFQARLEILSNLLEVFLKGDALNLSLTFLGLKV